MADAVDERFLEEGDPYYCHCRKTTRLLQEQLGLDDDAIVTTFQSKFGPEEWVGPATVEHVAELARRYLEGDGPALRVADGVDLGRAPAPRAADGLVVLPPFPPEAQRCAFTAEESIRTWEGGPPARARVSNRSLQTPLAAQRAKRL